MKTSEILGKKWAVRSTDKGMTQIIGNNVSYGPFVQDADHQAWFHADRGWKTTETVAKEEAAHVAKLVQKTIAKALKKR